MSYDVNGYRNSAGHPLVPLLSASRSLLLSSHLEQMDTYRLTQIHSETRKMEMFSIFRVSE